MIELTAAKLTVCMQMPIASAEVHAPHLERAMQVAAIDTAQRRAAFLAQLAHESGCLLYIEELADGSAYEGRLDLGNTQPGDGKRFKGRAWIQITGRANYVACGKSLKLDLIEHPEYLLLPEHAARASAWFWESRHLNQVADRDQFGLITKRINGGYNGLDDRIKHWLRIRKVFGL